MNTLSKHFSILLAISPIYATAVHADGCTDYPFSDGMQVQEVEGGFKILATATSVVDLDDTDEVLDALTFAEMDAKARIAKFFNEDIQVDDVKMEEVVKTVNISDEGKSVTKDKVSNYFKGIKSSSKQILRGVIRLGDCYTKGQFVRVTVGVKPETLNAAENTSGSMISSIKKTEQLSSDQGADTTGSNNQGDADNVTTGNTKSFSNTSGINNF